MQITILPAEVEEVVASGLLAQTECVSRQDALTPARPVCEWSSKHPRHSSAYPSPQQTWLGEGEFQGERFGAMRYAGMALILSGLSIIVLPVKWSSRFSRARRQIGGGTRSRSG